jgi:hypothetical protein
MRRDRRQRQLSVSDVLSGRVRPTAEELVQLIHETNPTDRAMRPSNRQRLYDIKARLQSLLVRLYRDQILVEPTSDEGVVGLRLHSGEDACHAIIATLDDDARSWVQFQLDTAGDEATDPASTSRLRALRSSEATPADGGPTTIEDFLRAARAARDAYDLELARELLSEAFEMEPSRRAAEPLLELLVDHLALFDDALAVADELPVSVVESAPIRLLLGTAAARKGDTEDVGQWLDGLEGARAADVLLELARSMLAVGDASGAENAANDARRQHPDHPDLVQVLDRIVQVRAREREPDEAELRALVDAGRDDEAVAKARDILKRWPDSKLARKVIADHERQLAVARTAELATQAAAAVAAGDSLAAIRLYEAAVAMGLPTPDQERVRDELERLRRAEHERDVREKTTPIVAKLQGDSYREGLRSYLHQHEEIRAAVRAERADDDVLRWLGAISESAPRVDAETAIDFVCAVRTASAVPNDRPDAVLQVLEPFEEMCGYVPHARRLLHEARAERRKRREPQARKALDGAVDALRDGQLESAMGIVESAVMADLAPAARATLRDVKNRLAELRELADQAAQVERLRAEGRPQAMRRALDRLVDRCDPKDRPRWLGELAGLDAWTQQLFRMRTFVLDCPLSEVRTATSSPAKRILSLRSSANEAVFTITSGRRLFFWVCNTTTKRVCRACALVLPETLMDICSTVDGNSVWVRSPEGYLLNLDLDTWRVAGWWHPRDVGMPCASSFTPTVSPRSRVLWIAPSLSPGSGLRFDLDALQVHRMSLTRCYAFHDGQNECVAHLAAGRVEIRSVKEGVASLRRLTVPGQTWEVAPSPSGAGVLVVAITKDRTASNGGLTAVWADEQMLQRGVHEKLEDCALDGIHAAVTALNSGVSWIIYSGRDGRVWLQALAQQGDCVGQSYRVELGDMDYILSDTCARRAFLVHNRVADATGPELLELGPTAPQLTANAPWTGESEGPDRTRLVTTMQAADTHLAAGEWYEVVDLLDTSLVHAHYGPQALARLARAYLNIDPREPERVFRRAVALSHYCFQFNQGDSPEDGELLEPAARWSREAMAELASEAERELSGIGLGCDATELSAVPWDRAWHDDQETTHNHADHAVMLNDQGACDE